MAKSKKEKGTADSAVTDSKAATATPNIDGREFVKIWQSANTPDDVAKHFGVDKEYVVRKAITMRKNGVQLQKMSRGRAKTNWADLAQYAKECLPKKAA